MIDQQGPLSVTTRRARLPRTLPPIWTPTRWSAWSPVPRPNGHSGQRRSGLPLPAACAHSKLRPGWAFTEARNGACWGGRIAGPQAGSGASCSAVAGLRTWCRSPSVARSRAGGAGPGHRRCFSIQAARSMRRYLATPPVITTAYRKRIRIPGSRPQPEPRPPQNCETPASWKRRGKTAAAGRANCTGGFTRRHSQGCRLCLCCTRATRSPG